MDDWIEMIEACFKRRPIIYTGPWFWRHIGSPTKYEKHPLWIATTLFLGLMFQRLGKDTTFGNTQKM
jgi:hypothetical protein